MLHCVKALLEIVLEGRREGSRLDAEATGVEDGQQMDTMGKNGLCSKVCLIWKGPPGRNFTFPERRDQNVGFKSMTSTVLLPSWSSDSGAKGKVIRLTLQMGYSRLLSK